MLDAKVGNNAEMPKLQQFDPSYFTAGQGWLAKRARRPLDRLM
jgi:hypothetical protein